MDPIAAVDGHRRSADLYERRWMVYDGSVRHDGLLTPMNSLLGFDCVVHMCEKQLPHCLVARHITANASISNPAKKVEDDGRTIPKAVMWSVYLNSTMGLIMAVTMCFCLGDLSEIVDTATG